MHPHAPVGSDVFPVNPRGLIQQLPDRFGTGSRQASSVGITIFEVT